MRGVKVELSIESKATEIGFYGQEVKEYTSGPIGCTISIEAEGVGIDIKSAINQALLTLREGNDNGLSLHALASIEAKKWGVELEPRNIV